jgi:hypothetical protein
MDTSIHDVLVTTLAELGLPVPTNVIQTMLIKDRYFAGWKFRYEGGFATLQAGGTTMEFCDERGTVLKSVGVE